MGLADIANHTPISLHSQKTQLLNDQGREIVCVGGYAYCNRLFHFYLALLVPDEGQFCLTEILGK